MQQEHKEAIQNNFTSLVARTDLDSVVTALYEKGVFSEEMIEQYRNNNEKERDRKRELYRHITRRGPDAFGHLVDALGELGYWDLARDLDPNSPFSGRPQSYDQVPKPNIRPADEFRSLSTLNRPKTEPPKVHVPPLSPPQPPQDNDNAVDDSEKVPFVVKKSTKFMEDDNKDLKLYKTRGCNRGVLVDFTYMQFDNDIEKFRNGVDVDCKNLKYLFNELGFRVLRYLNLTRDETIETLKSLNNVLVDIESVFIVVSSHGYERADSSDTDVRCKDGKLIRLYDIINYFNNRNMPALYGVPKVFIFQMCRGSNADYSWQDVSSRAPPQMPMPQGAVLDGQPVVQQAAAPASPWGQARRHPAPLYSDILIANSTLPGFVAYRDAKLGSWYIQALCEIFAERAHDCHVEKLFTLVDQRMQEKFEKQTSSVERWGFNKRLYLHPGLYEASPQQ